MLVGRPSLAAHDAGGHLRPGPPVFQYQMQGGHCPPNKGLVWQRRVPTGWKPVLPGSWCSSLNPVNRKPGRPTGATGGKISVLPVQGENGGRGRSSWEPLPPSPLPEKPGEPGRGFLLDTTQYSTYCNFKENVQDAAAAQGRGDGAGVFPPLACDLR